MKKYILFPVWIAITAMLAVSGCSHTSYLESSDGSDATNDEQGADRTIEESEPDTICVQVAGAVESPGVYELAVDARVYEAVDAAGGLTEDADESELNLAALLSDGQKLYIYTVQERERLLAETGADAGDAANAGDGRVNLNTADAAQLETLSGIGASKAAAILSYREAHGRFAKPEDLMNVDGIGTRTFEKIKDQITI